MYVIFYVLRGDVEWWMILLRGVGKGKGFEYNHKVMIMKFRSPHPSIMVTRKPMVCESLGKGLVV